MIKKVVLDKADRLYHFPFDLEDYFPRKTLRTSEKRTATIDLGHFRWPIAEAEWNYHESPLELAAAEDIIRLKAALADWLRKEYSLKIDPYREIFIGHGIRRTIFDLCLAFIEYGDIVLCPEPGLPAYRRCTIAAGGVPVSYPISERTEFKPSFKRLSVKLGKLARIMFLNNPHNPLGTVLDETDLAELVRVASKENIFIINDSAYGSLAKEKYVSLLAIPGGDKVALEVFSFSYAFGLKYLPFGFALGPSAIIAGLESITRTTGLFIPRAWVEYALSGINSYPSADLTNTRKNIDQSRLTAREMAEQFSWKVVGSDSAPFLWLRIPGRRDSASYAAALFRRRKILVLPGNAFGESCDGYVRLSLTATPDEFRAASERLTRGLIRRGNKGE
ncbi:MAG: pyridoxal phosphate-dependent aminotransferase [candidate division Zixibacteria bacterium]|nr:pyridoxal phosphate-dependent aminotransferase [candidate division Zixibacteria bacterium]